MSISETRSARSSPRLRPAYIAVAHSARSSSRSRHARLRPVARQMARLPREGTQASHGMEGQARPPSRRLRTERAGRQDRDIGRRMNSSETRIGATGTNSPTPAADLLEVGRRTARGALDARWAGRAPRFSRLLRAVAACVRAACPGWVRAVLPEAVAPARAAVPPVLHFASARSGTGALQETCGAMPQRTPPASRTHPHGVPCAPARNTPLRLRPRGPAQNMVLRNCPLHHWPTGHAGQRMRDKPPNPRSPTPSSELAEAGLSQGSRQAPKADPLPAARPNRIRPPGRGRGVAPCSGCFSFYPSRPHFF